MSNKISARKRLKDAIIKSKVSGVLSRQPNIEESVFPAKILDLFQLLSPYYNPSKLFEMVENCSSLDACIETMEANIDGFGHEFLFIGPKEKKFDKEVQDEKRLLIEFFSKVNEIQSFPILRRELRRDLETTGNAYIEVVRYPDKSLAALYRADARYMRLQVKQNKHVEVVVDLPRFGISKKTVIYKRFRRYCMLVNPVQGQLRWFKEYGDPRRMCAITGKYEDELENGETIQEEATEIIHLKHGNGVYGVPRWIGLTSTILGLQAADFVNYDLFNNQAVPPLAILVSNGTLTENSIEDIADLLESRKGVENFHKILLLEAVSLDSTGGMEGSKSTAKVDIKEFSTARKEDAIFKAYIELSEKRIRARYRLPPLYLGVAEEYSRSTSDTSKLVAEEQVFKPERNKFDELVNFTIMKELGAKYWKFSTIGPRMIEGNEVIEAFKKFADAGVLTINQGIRIVNHVLGLDATEYDQVWANYPVPIIMSLLNQGNLADVEELEADKQALVDTQEKLEQFKKWLEKSNYTDIIDIVKEMQGIIDTLYKRVIKE